MNEPREQLIGQIQAAGVDFVHLQFTDIPGAIKSVAVPASRLRRTLERGVWFDGSAVEGLARVAESDLYLRPDPATFSILPWASVPTARLLCDLCRPDGSPFQADPRQALKTALAAAAELGYDYRVGCEVEFFVFEDPGDGVLSPEALIPVDGGGYFDESADRAIVLCEATARALAGFGVEVQATHHEVAPGQHEIDLVETDALGLADAIVALKWTLRALGRRDNLLVSFMPKPLSDAPGSGMHVQQHLVARASGANAFADPAGRYGLSAVGGHFIAGQLAHTRGMCAVIAPLVNSYKRLMGGAEAPGQIAWARINRGALIRVPEVMAGEAALVELRAPDPSCNPYLALAAMLRTGLDGIKNETPLPEPVEQLILSEADNPDGSSGAPVPSTLAEALEELDWDPVVRDALGQAIYERFLAAKEREWLDFRRHISQWELQSYVRGA
jgi:glutamine synthetase